MAFSPLLAGGESVEQIPRKQPPLIRLKRFQLAPKSCAASPHPFMFPIPAKPSYKSRSLSAFSFLLAPICPGLSHSVRFYPKSVRLCPRLSVPLPSCPHRSALAPTCLTCLPRGSL